MKDGNFDIVIYKLIKDLNHTLKHRLSRHIDKVVLKAEVFLDNILLDWGQLI